MALGRQCQPRSTGNERVGGAPVGAVGVLWPEILLLLSGGHFYSESAVFAQNIDFMSPFLMPSWPSSDEEPGPFEDRVSRQVLMSGKRHRRALRTAFGIADLD